MTVKPLRIRPGSGYMWAGVGCFALAIFAGLAASGGSASAGAFSIGFSLLGASLITLGFWRNLFSKIEERLMDIEKAVRAEPQEPALPPSVRPEAGPSDAYLG